MQDKDKKKDNLVTLAVLSYTKAEILKTILEDNGIETFLMNMNQIQPVISAGVRVRIKESDLSKALEISENTNDIFPEKKENSTNPEDNQETILIPIDFSKYSMKACEFGFKLAQDMNANIVLLHVYFTPVYAASLPNGDIFNYQKQGFNREASIIHKQVEDKSQNLANELDELIDSGKLPAINYIVKLREGIPEEEIVRYARRHDINLIIMGTRGSSQKKEDLIGSVTAEVMDRCDTTVLAIPENKEYKPFDQVKNIAFLTNLDPRDIIALDDLLHREIKISRCKLSLVRVTDEHNRWDEIELGGIKEYLTNKYKELTVEFEIVRSDHDFGEAMQEFVDRKNIELITLTSYRRNLFARLFNPSMARKMVFQTDVPMLVINVDKNK